MIRIVALTILLFNFFTLEVLGQTFPKEYWKEIVDDSKTIITGTVDESFQVIRPENYKPNPGTSDRNPRDFIIGELFRIKKSKKLKGKVKKVKDDKNEYVYIFVLGGGLGIPGIGDPVLLPKREYVFFLSPTICGEDLKGKETIDYKLQSEIIRKPFDCELSYSIVHSFRGAVEIKTNKEKLIEEIKNSF